MSEVIHRNILARIIHEHTRARDAFGVIRFAMLSELQLRLNSERSGISYLNA